MNQSWNKNHFYLPNIWISFKSCVIIIHLILLFEFTAHLSFAFICIFYKVSMLWDKAKFLCSTLNPSKKFTPLKSEKRAVRFLIRICPQYWVSNIRGHIIPTALFSHSCILFSRNFSAPLLFILTDKIKNPKPLISKKFGISVWCRWRGSNPHVLANTGFWIPGVCQFHHTGGK